MHSSTVHPGSDLKDSISFVNSSKVHNGIDLKHDISCTPTKVQSGSDQKHNTLCNSSKVQTASDIITTLGAVYIYSWGSVDHIVVKY